MSTLTTKLGLIMPDGNEPFPNRVQTNTNWDLIDDHIGEVVCTSGTRPSSPYAGQVIYETDTLRTLIRNTTNTFWTTVSGIPVVNTTADVAAPYNGQIVYALGNGSLWRYQSSNTTWYRYPDEQTIYKATTESVTSSTTLQNDNDFSFTVRASTAYAVESCIFTDGALDPAGGLKMDFTGPASASMLWNNGGPNGAGGSGTVTDYNAVAEGLAPGSPRGVATNAATPMTYRPAGTLVVAGTAGTLQFRWAQRTSNATATRILGGSWMRLSKISFP